ncbi:hypothetical protein, partial [uncultured Chryseobacterium sp.]|uniref:hypothetical protein n=1 Tax=uncultured Chryseobacterium sp. TaxID=259322 RepID=UPI00258DFB23
GRLTVDNLQGGYSTGSAVADFMFRTGLSADERNMPLFYRNEGGGGGKRNGGPSKSNPGPGIIERFISWLFGRKKKAGRLEVGQVERVSMSYGQTALFGLIRNANVNANGESPLEQYRSWRDNPSYHEGESWLDRFARNVNSSHMEILRDEGSCGGLMYGGFGRGIAVAEETAGIESTIVNLTEETFTQALYNGAENVNGYSVYGTKGLVGNTFNRNIFLLEASGSKSLSGFRTLVGGMEAETISAGATKISIYGSSVINKGFLNSGIAQRFGYSFEKIGTGVVLQKALK